MCVVIEMWKFILLLHIVLLSNGDAQKPISDQKYYRENEIFDLTDTVETFQNGFTYRLPNNTQPESYEISIGFGNFNESDMSFDGRVRITINVLEDTNQITLHSSVNIIVSIELALVTPTVGVIDATHIFDVESEFLIITTATTLYEGSKVQIDIAYLGNIGTSVAGVYRGSYLNNANEQRCECSPKLFK